MSDIVIGLTLRADGKGFVGEVRSVRGELQQLGVTAKRAGGDLGDLGGRAERALAPLRSLQTTLAGLGIAIAAKQAVAEFAAYERGLVGVAKTADLTGSQVKEMGAAVTAMARTMPFARTELLQVAQAGGQLGVKGVADLTLFAQTIAKLGTASDLAGEEAATSLTRILNVTGESIGRIDELASVIVRLGNNSAASESEIARVTTQVAQATSQFRLSSDQAAALGAALRSVGVQAELGGSAVGKTFRVIDGAIRGGGEQMGELSRLTGLTGKQLRETFATDSAEVFKLFVEGLGRVAEGGGSVTEVLARLGLEGDEILKVLPTLALRSDLVGKALAMAAKEAANATALNDEYGRASETLTSKLKLASNALDEISVTLGEALAPQIVQATKDLQAFVQAAIDSGQAAVFFETVADAVALLAGNMDVLAALMTGRVGVSLGAAIGSIFGPLGTVLGGVAGAAAGFGATMVALDGDVRGAIPGLRDLGSESERAGVVMATSMAGGRSEVEATTQSFVKPGGLIDAIARAATQFNEFAKRDLAENPITEDPLNVAVVDGTLAGLKALGNSVLGLSHSISASVLTVLNEPFDVLSNGVFWEKIDENFIRGTSTDWVGVYWDRVTADGKVEIAEAISDWQNDIDAAMFNLPVGPTVTATLPIVRTAVDTGLPADVKALLEQLDPLTKMLREAGNAESLLTANQDKLAASGQDLYSLLALLDRQLDAYAYGLGEAARAAGEQAKDLVLQAQVRKLEAEGTEAARRRIVALTTARELERVELQRTAALMAAQPGQIGAINAAYDQMRAAIAAAAAAEQTWSATQATTFKALADRLDPVAAKYREVDETSRLLLAALDAGKISGERYIELLVRLGQEVEAFDAAQGEAARSTRQAAEDLELQNQVRRLELEGTAESRAKIAELTTTRELERLEIERTQELLTALPDQVDAVNAAYDRMRLAIRDKGAVDELRRLRDESAPLLETFKNAARGIQRGFADAFTSMFSKGKFGFKDMLDTWGDAFARMLGEMATLAIARPVIVPMVSALGAAMGLSAGDIGGVTAQFGGSAAGSAMSGMVSPFTSAIGSFFNPVTAGVANIGSNFATGGIGAALLGSAPVDISGGIGAMIAPGSQGLFGAAGSLSFAGVAPWLAAAAIAVPLLTGMFDGPPSVGPTGVARLPGVIGRSPLELTTDNGGSTDQVEAVAKSIREAATQAAEDLGARGSRAFGLDIGGFPNPEKGSGQSAGFNLKRIIDGVLEADDFATGLTSEEAVAAGVRETLLRAFEDFENADVGTALRKTVADNLQDLLSDLTFADEFRDMFAPVLDAAGPLKTQLDTMRDSFEDARDRAQELGLATEGLATRFAAANDNAKLGFRVGLGAEAAGVGGAFGQLLTLGPQIGQLITDAAIAGVDTGTLEAVIDGRFSPLLQGLAEDDLGPLIGAFEQLVGQVQGADVVVRELREAERDLAADRRAAAAQARAQAASDRRIARQGIAGALDPTGAASGAGILGGLGLDAWLRPVLAGRIDATLAGLTGQVAQDVTAIQSLYDQVVDGHRAVTADQLDTIIDAVAEESRARAELHRQTMDQLAQEQSERADFARQTGSDIGKYLAGLRASNDSGDPYAERLAAARQDFVGQLSVIADSSDETAVRTALSSITDFAETYRSLLREGEASGVDYRSGLAFIETALATLPMVQSDTDRIVDAIAAQPGILAQAIAAEFSGLDLNGDLALSLDELRQALGEQASESTLQAVLSQLDADGDGTISALEAVADNTGIAGPLAKQQALTAFYENLWGPANNSYLKQLVEAMTQQDAVSAGRVWSAALGQDLSTTGQSGAAGQDNAARANAVQGLYGGDWQSYFGNSGIRGYVQDNPGFLADMSALFTAAVDWDEQRYLSLNPDVGSAVSDGTFDTGLQHYLLHGIHEGRRFEHGGDHMGGLRLVGERGWEIEATGPSRIWNQEQLGRALTGASNDNSGLEQRLDENVRETRALHATVDRWLSRSAAAAERGADEAAGLRRDIGRARGVLGRRRAVNG